MVKVFLFCLCMTERKGRKQYKLFSHLFVAIYIYTFSLIFTVFIGTLVCSYNDVR
jgi:hypothetical protein